MINKIRNSSFLSFGKKSVLKSLISEDFLSKTTLRILSKHDIEPVSIKIFLDEISPDIDKRVLDYAMREAVNPLGGEILISIKEEEVTLKTNLYFQHKNKIFLNTSEKKVSSKIFTEEDLIQIRNSSVKYNIDPPYVPTVY